MDDTLVEDLPLTTRRGRTGPPLLEVRGLDFTYGQLQVLFGVDLVVHEGESLALVGTNGAGKSTVLRAVSGLQPPSGGEVRFAGRDITGMPAEKLVAEGLVLIPGGKAVFTDMTVEENLEIQSLPIRGQGKLSAERRDVVFTTFPRLRERLSTPAGKLSGGEQQQLALAKALLLDPALLCIDELSLGLAPVVVGELIEVVERLKAAGITLIIVEQSLNIAAQLCDHAVFLEKGEVQFEGSPRELLEKDDIARAVFFGAS